MTPRQAAIARLALTLWATLVVAGLLANHGCSLADGPGPDDARRPHPTGEA